MKPFPVLVLVALLPLLGGCRSAYYRTLETFGVHKRDLLVERVEEGKEQQQEAQEQFQSTFERFKAITGVDAGEIETVYAGLAGELERCESEARQVASRIRGIEAVAGDLFDEWEREIDQLSSPDLRRKSADKLENSRRTYRGFLAAMKRAESTMEPVLVAFRDQVLYLKHNLNARAIADLESTVLEIEDDVARLIADMQASIEEAERFLGTVES